MKKHICCDGGCNHDDCCGKISENCPNFDCEDGIDSSENGNTKCKICHTQEIQEWEEPEIIKEIGKLNISGLYLSQQQVLANFISQKQKDTIREEFNKEFTYGVLLSASSDLSQGEDIAFKYVNLHPNIMSDWWLQKLEEAYQQGARDKVEEVMNKEEKNIIQFLEERGYTVIKSLKNNVIQVESQLRELVSTLHKECLETKLITPEQWDEEISPKLTRLGNIISGINPDSPSARVYKAPKY